MIKTRQKTENRNEERLVGHGHKEWLIKSVEIMTIRKKVKIHKKSRGKNQKIQKQKRTRKKSKNRQAELNKS